MASSSSDRLLSLAADKDAFTKLIEEKDQRPTVVIRLKAELSRIQNEIALCSGLQAPRLLSAQPGEENSSAQANGIANKDFTSITDFAWDQDSQFVKVYVRIPGGDMCALPKENVKVDFYPDGAGFSLVVLHGPNGKHYRLNMKKLSHPINAEKSSFRVKKESLTITLSKKSMEWWTDLAFKESLIKKDKSLGKDMASGDPNQSIMGLMKNLYEEGDDDMKRTIAKAWTEANAKKMSGGSAADDLLPGM